MEGTPPVESAAPSETPSPAADGSVGTTLLVKPGTGQLEIPGGEVKAGGRRRRKVDIAAAISASERAHLERFVGEYPIATLAAVGTFLGICLDLPTSDIPAEVVTAALSQGHTEADLISWSKTLPTRKELRKTRLQATLPVGAPPPKPPVILDDDTDDDEEKGTGGSPLILEESQMPPPPASPAPVPGTPTKVPIAPGGRFLAAAQRIALAETRPAGAVVSTGTTAVVPTPAALSPAPPPGAPSPASALTQEFTEEGEAIFMRWSALEERVAYTKAQGAGRMAAVLRQEIAFAPRGLALTECGGGGNCLFHCLAQALGETTHEAERDRAMAGLVGKVPALMLLLESLKVDNPTAGDVKNWMARHATPNEYAEAPALMGWALAARRCVKVALDVTMGSTGFHWQCYGAACDPVIFLRLDSHHYMLWDEVQEVVDEVEATPSVPLQVQQPPRVAEGHLAATQEAPPALAPSVGAAGHIMAGGSVVVSSMSGDDVATRLHQLEQAHTEEIRALGLRVHQLEAALRDLSPPRGAAPPLAGGRSRPHEAPNPPLVGPRPTVSAPSAVVPPTPAVRRGGRGPASPAGPAPAGRFVERTCWTCGLAGHIARWCPRNGGVAPPRPPGMGVPPTAAAPRAPAVVPPATPSVRHQKVVFAEVEHRQQRRKHHRSSASMTSVSSGSLSDSSSSGAGSGSRSTFRRSRYPRSRHEANRQRSDGGSRPRGGSRRGRGAANRVHRQASRGASPVHAPRHTPPSSRSRSPVGRAEVDYLTGLLLPRQRDDRSRGTGQSEAPAIDPELLGRLLLGKRL